MTKDLKNYYLFWSILGLITSLFVLAATIAKGVLDNFNKTVIILFIFFAVALVLFFTISLGYAIHRKKQITKIIRDVENVKDNFVKEVTQKSVVEKPAKETTTIKVSTSKVTESKATSKSLSVDQTTTTPSSKNTSKQDLIKEFKK